MISRLWISVAAAVALTGCSSDVAQKVKYDFGVGEKPAGYVSSSEKIMANLAQVGATEMQRLNAEARQGEVKFAEDGEFRGKYYKQSKLYDRAIPIDANAAPKTAVERDTRVFYGYIDYTYRIYQGPRRDTRAEAEADRAIVATGESGRESYRYKFGPSGEWNGGRGELLKD